MGLAVGSLIQSFEWARVGPQLVDLGEGNGLTMPKALPLEALCKPRRYMIDILDKLWYRSRMLLNGSSFLVGASNLSKSKISIWCTVVCEKKKKKTCIMVSRVFFELDWHSNDQEQLAIYLLQLGRKLWKEKSYREISLISYFVEINKFFPLPM